MMSGSPRRYLCDRRALNRRQLIAALCTSLLAGCLLLSWFNERSCREQPTREPQLDDVIAKATPADSSASSYARSQRLRGLVLKPSTPVGGDTDELENVVTWSLVATFSPAVENHVRLMFRDRFNECQFHAMGPAISRWNGTLVANIRVWLAQYLLSKFGKVKPPVDSWQENYVYSVRLDDDYRPVAGGGLLGIPATTNTYASYRKDGPMDPRSFVFRGRLYLLYYAYARDSPTAGAVARMYLWDYERNVKTKLTVDGLTLQSSSDINWVPLVTTRSLYLIYSLDPLRVLRCDPVRGLCAVVYQQSADAKHAFSNHADHLRGGTPFVAYRHPYYFSLAHSVASTANYWSIYRTHLVVLCVSPWRVVYVSDHIEANDAWLHSVPVVINAYIFGPFWYPTSLMVRSADVVDVGCHLSDHSSYVVRLAGVRGLLESVVRKDACARGRCAGAPVRAVQQYILDCYKRAYAGQRWLRFMSDVSRSRNETSAS